MWIHQLRGMGLTGPPCLLRTGNWGLQAEFAAEKKAVCESKSAPPPLRRFKSPGGHQSAANRLGGGGGSSSFNPR